jgi:hypothetical protein
MYPVDWIATPACRWDRAFVRRRRLLLWQKKSDSSEPKRDNSWAIFWSLTLAVQLNCCKRFRVRDGFPSSRQPQKKQRPRIFANERESEFPIRVHSRHSWLIFSAIPNTHRNQSRIEYNEFIHRTVIRYSTMVALFAIVWLSPALQGLLSPSRHTTLNRTPPA